MRAAEGNPLDLNNLPGDQDHNITCRDHGKQLLNDNSSSASGGGGGGGGHRKKKSSGSGGAKDESGKVYECRFCSLKFCKSQALGGHMNRHRQERETETLNRARQLVLTNDNLIPSPATPHRLVGGQPIAQGAYPPPPPPHHHQTAGHDPFRSVYPAARLFSGSSSSTIVPPPPPPPPSYMYHSPSRLVGYPPSHYNINPQPMNDYLVGHVLSGANTQLYPNYTTTAAPPETNYTCIGAPVGHGKRGSDMGGISGTDMSFVQNNNFNNNQ